MAVTLFTLIWLLASSAAFVALPESFDESLKTWLTVNETQSVVTMEAYENLLKSLQIGSSSNAEPHDHEPTRSSVDETCFSSTNLLLSYGILADENSTIDWFSYANLTRMFPAFIQQQVYEVCSLIDDTYDKPSTLASFGFGTLAVVVISILPFLFVAVIPSTKRRSYRYIMNFLMALSTSTLLGDAFLHLIPQSLSIHGHSADQLKNQEDLPIQVEDFVLKNVVLLAALYSFYLFQMLISGRHHANAKGGGLDHGHSHLPQSLPTSRKTSMKSKPGNEQVINIKTNDTSSSASSVDVDAEIIRSESIINDSDAVLELENVHIRPSCATLDIDNVIIQRKGTLPGEEPASTNDDKSNCFLKLMSGMIPERTLGWMVIVGDAIHNLVDGIAMGAAFSGNIVSGLSTAIAICCHEIPHEVGDFAALLTAGVSYRGALAWNVVHSFLSLGGLYLGIAIGADDASRQWVYALTAGMFIYVSLTEMMPELTRVHGEFWKYFALQNLGLMLGFGLMFLIAIVEDKMIIGMEDLFSS